MVGGVMVVGHTGVVGAQLYRWLQEIGTLHLAGISLDRRDGPHERLPDWVFVCVPTPTTSRGQNTSSLGRALASYVGHHLSIVIRSTVLPGTCERLAHGNPEWDVYHWPEFLSARQAWRDFSQPAAQVVGHCGSPIRWADRWERELPDPAHGWHYVGLREAETVKYAHNLHGATQVTLANTLYDLAGACDFEAVKTVLPALGYLSPAIMRGYWDIWCDGQRGYAGACFPKDVWAAQIELGWQGMLLQGMTAANDWLHREAV